MSPARPEKDFRSESSWARPLRTQVVAPSADDGRIVNPGCRARLGIATDYVHTLLLFAMFVCCATPWAAFVSREDIEAPHLSVRNVFHEISKVASRLTALHGFNLEVRVLERQPICLFRWSLGTT